MKLSATCALGLLLLAAPLAASTRVELVINEPYADRSAPWGVTTGVPFPRGGLASPDNCRLVDDTGREVALQSRVAATWDAEKKSIRWLTIDFIAQPGRKYSLEFGPEIKPHAIASPLQVTKGDVTRVVTGPLAVDFAKTGPTSLAAIAVDLNGDRRVEASETLAAGAKLGEHYYLDQAGTRFSSAGDGADRTITVEAWGPVRACVRVDGFYTGPKGQRIAKYRTRYHFYAGLAVVKVIDELGLIGSTKETRFRDIGFALDTQLGTEGRIVTVDRLGDAGNQLLSQPWQTDTQSIASFQTVYRHYGNPETHAAVAVTSPQGSTQLSQSDRVGEWLQVADARGAITGSLRWFWQQFPKEWEAKADSLTLHLWSPRAGELDFGQPGIEKFFGPWGEHYLRAGWETKQRNPLEKYFNFADYEAILHGAADGLGINKHHEFYLHFAPAKEQKQGPEYGRLAAEQPLALATGEWNCSTDVFGPLAARPNDSKYEAIVDWIFDNGRKMQDQFGDYGWWLFGAGPHYSYQWDEQTQRHYADSRRFEFHTYQKETQFWWHYVRSGERKFYDWAFPSENHWCDVAVSHMPTTIECGFKGGDPEQRTIHWRPGEWAIDSATHYVRHHERAEAWLRGGAQFWASYHRTLETTSLAYYLTGDERYNDVINYWRTYWGDLAGKTNKSADFAPWYQEQAWYKPAAAGDAEKSWAEMIRDYAPFRSGSRHQMTLFFNLATLYEHTWDPKIGLAVKEYADAFLDPRHPIGVWRSQDNSLPVHGESPSLMHYWSPALWKYARVTGDPRMKDILARYFDAAYAADPFRQLEDVGVYSNNYPAYAYYFTRDARHLSLAASELEQLLPFAAPLTKQQEMMQRLYNPYAVIRANAGTPRLIWALQQAKRDGVAIPPAAPLRPQRTAIALHKEKGKALQATLWGYEPKLTLLGPDGKPATTFTAKSRNFASKLQPFDRVMPDFQVYLVELNVPADAPAGEYVIPPHLEWAVLDMHGGLAPLANAQQTMSIGADEPYAVNLPAGTTKLTVECSLPAQLKASVAGQPLEAKVTAPTVEFAFDKAPTGPITLSFAGETAWFRVVSSEPVWVSRETASLKHLPSRAQTDAIAVPTLVASASEPFTKGRFGQAVQVVTGKPLHIPDHLVAGGEKQPLFDRAQGTLEFWVKKGWDERLAGRKSFALLSNGIYNVHGNSTQLPLDEWCHVAICWAPYRGDAERTLYYTYVDGVDRSNYRSVDWEGYSSARPQASSKPVRWLEELLCQAAPGTTFAIDEVRLSSVARYIDPTLKFGPQQTFNPYRFDPPAAPFAADAQTRLLLHFDESFAAQVPASGVTARVGK